MKCRLTCADERCDRELRDAGEARLSQCAQTYLPARRWVRDDCPRLAVAIMPTGEPYRARLP